MMMHWGDKEKKGKRGEVDRKSKELELYDPQHHQVGSEAAIRGKQIATVSTNPPKFSSPETHILLAHQGVDFASLSQQ